MIYDPHYVLKESDLLGTGANEQDDFHPDLIEWNEMLSEQPLEDEDEV